MAGAAAYVINWIFDAHPGLGGFEPNPDLDKFDSDARLVGLKVKGQLWTISSSGAVLK